MASAFGQDGSAANSGNGNGAGSNGNGDYFSRPRVRSSGTTMISPGTAGAGAPGTSGGLARSPVVRIATPPPTAFGTEKEISP